MKRVLCIIPVLCFLTHSFAQAGKVLMPYIGQANNYSRQEAQRWESIINTYNNSTLPYEKLSTRQKARIDSLDMGYGPFTQGVECSWYCGGQMYKVTASSYLKGNEDSSYMPDRIHDFDLRTAWVPDKAKGAVGSRISFHFKPLSPRVNEITIYNGYIKNYELFKANGRVKKFRLYINHKLYAVLHVSDTTAGQTFQIPPVRSTDKQKDLVLTFEIAEVYKGSKYKDVAISEINFSGMDVH